MSHPPGDLKDAFVIYPKSFRSNVVTQDFSDPDLLILDQTDNQAFIAELRIALQSRGIRANMVQSGMRPGVPVFLVRNIEPRELSQTLQELLRTNPIIWSFDSQLGFCTGPIIRNRREFSDYLESTSAYVDDKLIDSHFPSTRPCSIGSNRASPSFVAESLESLLNDSEEGRVMAWGQSGPVPKICFTRLRVKPYGIASLPLLTGPFGIIRNVTVETIGSPLGEIHIHSCRSPAGGRIPTLESNSGKGLTREQAHITMVGEAIERVAAFFANDLETVQPLINDFPLKKFSPFGPLWTERDRLKEDLDERVLAQDLLSGEIVTVPKVSVAFPYISPSGARPSSGDTTGLAAYPSREGAIIRGLREVLERDVFYSGFLHQRGGHRLEPKWADDIRLERIWFEDCPFPAVHTFAFESTDMGTVVGRGSGSGLTWADADDASAVETFQVLTQMHRGAPQHEGSAYDIWRNQLVVDELQNYLAGLPIDEPKRESHPMTDELQVSMILDFLASRGQRAFVVDLPRVFSDISVVRILIPGASTNTYESSGAGGKKLKSPKWTHGIPV